VAALSVPGVYQVGTDGALVYATHRGAMGKLHRDYTGASDPPRRVHEGARRPSQFLPVIGRGELCVADAVRAHLIADHKRSEAEAGRV